MRRTRKLSIVVSDRERELVRRAAAARGFTISTFSRRCLVVAAEAALARTEAEGGPLYAELSAAVREASR